jgi:hypothetical protein
MHSYGTKYDIPGSTLAVQGKISHSTINRSENNAISGHSVSVLRQFEALSKANRRGIVGWA